MAPSAPDFPIDSAMPLDRNLHVSVGIRVCAGTALAQTRMPGYAKGHLPGDGLSLWLLRLGLNQRPSD